MKASMPAVNDDMGISEDDDEDDEDVDVSDEDEDAEEEVEGDDDEEEEEDEDEDEDEQTSSKNVFSTSKKGKGKQKLESDSDGMSFVHPCGIGIRFSYLYHQSHSNLADRILTPYSPDSDEFPDFDEEEDDLISLDEMPDIVLNGSPSPEPGQVGEDGEDEAIAGKRKRKDERKERKKKRREAPVFGSYEDYAALIEAGGEEEED